VSKSGAEGFEGVGVLAQGLGLAVKVEDGSSRASPPVVVAALRQLKVMGPRHERDLEAHLGRVLRNWAGLRVGGMQASFTLRRATGRL
jgi:L-asparaginase II